MIDDGSGLLITYIVSTSLTTTTISQLDNILYIPNMNKNLISISQFCTSNNVFVEFLPSYFLAKDLRIRVILLKGQMKDEVYEWPISSPKSSPLFVFSSNKTISSEWHHRSSHPAFLILKRIASHYQVRFVLLYVI